MTFLQAWDHMYFNQCSQRRRLPRRPHPPLLRRAAKSPRSSRTHNLGYGEDDGEGRRMFLDGRHNRHDRSEKSKKGCVFQR
eukprot:TRINITY_DN15047_c0_g1_i1.p1 TRINITY_DN15047_c0_g1~~TRINITY_DN15047_c0_g1_i1.p1  ORF type:complete len:81 (-),score=17.24 TRINITY_DN15047_c0_g1_i1:239-481(-)